MKLNGKEIGNNHKDIEKAADEYLTFVYIPVKRREYRIERFLYKDDADKFVEEWNKTRPGDRSSISDRIAFTGTSRTHPDERTHHK